MNKKILESEINELIENYNFGNYTKEEVTLKLILNYLKKDELELAWSILPNYWKQSVFNKVENILGEGIFVSLGGINQKALIKKSNMLKTFLREKKLQ